MWCSYEVEKTNPTTTAGLQTLSITTIFPVTLADHSLNFWQLLSFTNIKIMFSGTLLRTVTEQGKLHNR